MQQKKVGREEEGSSSNRPELAAFVLALRGTPMTNPTNLFVQQPSAAESCKKMGRRRWKSDVSRSARRRHFTGSNRSAPKKNTSRSSDVSGQIESVQTKKPTSKQTRLSQAKVFPRNGATGQIEQSSHGKSLAGKEVR